MGQQARRLNYPKGRNGSTFAQYALTCGLFLQSVTDKRIAENFKSVEISQKAYDKLCEFGQSKPARFSESSFAAALCNAKARLRLTDTPITANDPIWPVSIFDSPAEKAGNPTHEVILKA